MIDFLGPVLYPAALIGFTPPPLRSEPVTTGLLRSSRVIDLADHGLHAAVTVGLANMLISSLR